ncbi:hypothetical protein CLAFUW4_05802 [Fulvia fulva]|uniref:Uncharacterized protein n=1 Tax=Passalora fulva TaxID=5499 RepID=A0A9Q8P9D8_PASFU|nr:uncharacterized protein CLAFUR5_05943 [Fulvia fulva]KAK4623986.1 hypothetical protein CLAFUR4_05796 [Fulvia fulva]KAK4624828.1 hypothetical protein CLAFUR0_05807 [Fulvia fulva]UJO17957.1 hypothetical protein CLAFUR5_05943 [Fulvia fulva]WPV14716.1 hypothetical protein CLAFUW4_05802 [Fulvia fulva]WPV29744.1 hypothetical protein CLAFUW7_05800 [Fulvia fulva]
MSYQRTAAYPHIDSSEDTPSEHSSLYTAWPTASPLKDASEGACGRKSRSEEPGSAERQQHILAGCSNPEKSAYSGTRLFAITEHGSIATLRTMPSSWTFQQRLVGEQAKGQSDND